MAATNQQTPPSTNMRKRKAATDAATNLKARGSPKRKKPNPKKPDMRKNASSHFRFMDLPGELRDNVYEKLFEGRPTRLSRNSANKTLAIESGLSRTCRQIRSEMLDLALLSAPIIQTTVRNYNFSHLIGFFNRLSAAQLSKIETLEQAKSAARIVRIKFIFTTGCAPGRRHEPSFENLARWLNRVENPGKKGTQIDFQYRMVGTCDSNWWPRVGDVDPATSTGRRFREARKILKAILKQTVRDYTDVHRWRLGGLKEEVEGEDEEW